jgi:replication fork clamp-binding protein CrfC
MKEKQLQKTAKKILQLEANIEKDFEVEESQQEIERIMRKLTMEEVLQLDDLIFKWKS